MVGEGGVPYLAVRSARPSSYLSDPVVLLLPLLAYASSSASSASSSLDRHRGTPCLPLYPLSPALFGPRIFRRSPLVTHAMHPCCSSLGRLMVWLRAPRPCACPRAHALCTMPHAACMPPTPRYSACRVSCDTREDPPKVRCSSTLRRTCLSPRSTCLTFGLTRSAWRAALGTRGPWRRRTPDLRMRARCLATLS